MKNNNVYFARITRWLRDYGFAQVIGDDGQPTEDSVHLHRSRARLIDRFGNQVDFTDEFNPQLPPIGAEIVCIPNLDVLPSGSAVPTKVWGSARRWKEILHQIEAENASSTSPAPTYAPPTPTKGCGDGISAVELLMGVQAKAPVAVATMQVASPTSAKTVAASDKEIEDLVARASGANKGADHSKEPFYSAPKAKKGKRNRMPLAGVNA